MAGLNGDSRYHLCEIRRAMRECARMKALGQHLDDTKNHAGWSPADSYEDAIGWAQYHAGQIIAGAKGSR